MKKIATYISIFTIVALAFAGFTGFFTQAQAQEAELEASIEAPSTGAEFETGESISFEAGAAGGTAPYAFNWNFGDGTEASGANFSKSYDEGGTYTVAVEVTDIEGNTDAADIVISVSASDDGGDDNGDDENTLDGSITAPANSSEFEVGESITFEAQASGGTSPFAFDWDFGDGDGALGSTFDKAYDEAGTFTVTIEITDIDGNTTNDSVTVTVAEDGNGGGGGDDLTISNVEATNITETSATITWTTNLPSNSRVIFGTESVDVSGQSAPNFGYPSSTDTFDTDTKVTEHSVDLTGLSPDTQYFFRVLSQE